MTRGLAWLLVLAAACGGQAAPPEQASWPEPARDAITKVTEAGPVKATVSLWPAKPTLGDPLWLRLTVESKPGVAAEVPLEIDAMGRFAVSRFDRSERRRDDGGLVQTRNFELAAPSSGKQRIPPLRLEIIDQRAAVPTADAGVADVAVASAAPVELLTEEIPVEIAPVLAAKTSAELRPALGALEPTVGASSPWPYLAGGAGAVVVLLAGVMAARAIAARRELQARLTAYDQAMARLRALEASGAPASDAADGWFVELSSIVRSYMEGRFRLRAPELTTEEFLQEARRASELRGEHRDLLSSFLERCDQVKFAGYRPGADESMASLAAARTFVEDTRVRDLPPTPPPASAVAGAA